MAGLCKNAIIGHISFDIFHLFISEGLCVYWNLAGPPSVLSFLRLEQ